MSTSSNDGSERLPRFFYPPGTNAAVPNWGQRARSESVTYLNQSSPSSSHSVADDGGEDQIVETGPPSPAAPPGVIVPLVQRGSPERRPPLPPARSPYTTTKQKAEAPNNNRSKVQQHNRGISELSALTAETFNGGGEGKKQKQRSHARGVSWGGDFANLGPQLSDSDQSAPELGAAHAKKEENRTPRPILSGLPPPPQNLSPPLQPILNPQGDHTRTKTQLTLTDLAASPLEEEAEHAIIKAIEKREWEKEQDEDDELREALGKKHEKSYSVLPNIPDEAIEMVATAANEGSSAESSNKDGEQDADAPEDDNGNKIQENATDEKRKPTMREMTGKLKKQSGFADVGPKQSTRHIMPRIESAEDMEEINEPISSADVMMNNADILFGENLEGGDTERFDVESQLPTPKQAHQRTTSTMSAISDWSKRRLTVHPASSRPLTSDGIEKASAKKKDDDEMGTLDIGSRYSGNDSSQIKRGRVRTSIYVRRNARKSKWVLSEALKPQLPGWRVFIKTVLFLVFVPMISVASLLFYVWDNPIEPVHGASYSWWVLFLGVRQVCTFALAKLTEVILIDIFTLHTRLTLSIFGPLITLMSLQARGWPFRLTFWAIWDFGLLYGGGKFANHWLYYQDYVRMFNEGNPAGSVLTLELYLRTLIAAIVVGFAASLKRVLLAVYLGKKSCEHYGPQLEKLLHRLLLISEVAHMAEEIAQSNSNQIVEESQHRRGSAYDIDYKKLKQSIAQEDEEDEDSDVKSQQSRFPAPQTSDVGMPPSQHSTLRLRKNTGDTTTMASIKSRRSFKSPPSPATPAKVLDAAASDDDETTQAPHLNLQNSAKVKLRELLGEWEEPEIKSGPKARSISVQDVLEFRRGVACINGRYPFSTAFGSAKTREQCVESAQNVYERLLLKQPWSSVLSFETVALVAVEEDGSFDEDKARKLLKLFRPDRNGNLTLVDFAKSCDRVYKRLRLLSASVANSSQIDLAFEKLLNVVVFFVLIMIVLFICNFDPWTLLISLSGLILSFAFMFGSAASKYFEGILLILVRRPFDIGDRIAVSHPDQDTDPNGSATWFVEGVSLFTTTVRNAATNEVATYANGALANSRIINGARSPKAQVYIYLKFASDISYEKVMVFKSVIESFVKERPRHWIAMSGFRATRVETDQGFIEYVLVLKHVESWQQIVPILSSKAEVASYCLEVQKKLDMKYSAPPLPVNLGMRAAHYDGVEDVSMFERSETGASNSKVRDVDFRSIEHLFSQGEVRKTNKRFEA